MGGYTKAVSGRQLGKNIPKKQTTQQRPLLAADS
jgi:hypothetical protein